MESGAFPAEASERDKNPNSTGFCEKLEKMLNPVRVRAEVVLSSTNSSGTENFYPCVFGCAWSGYFGFSIHDFMATVRGLAVVGSCPPPPSPDRIGTVDEGEN